MEVKKASYEFDRDVAKVLREKRGVMMGAEKVIRYFEDRMRAKVSKQHVRQGGQVRVLKSHLVPHLNYKSWK